MISQKIFLFGGTSILGWNMLLSDKDKRLIPFCSPFSQLKETQNWNRLNLEDKESYQHLFSSNLPEAVLHCGGICDVDKAQENPDWAYTINVKGVEALLEALPSSVRLVYVSSDHVFGGRIKPYTEKSRPSPISVYGRTRVLAEKIVLKRKNSLVLRVGLPIGAAPNKKIGHLNWLTYRNKKNLPLSIVRDEFRSVVWAKDAAKRVWDYLDSNVTGLRHLSSTKPMSRLELANILNERFRIGARFQIQSRKDRKGPHLGRVELSTVFTDRFSQPLPKIEI